MGGEDFSFFTQKMSAVVFVIGSENETHVIREHLHSHYFVIDEEAVPMGAAFHVAVAISYLNSHGGVAANLDELITMSISFGITQNDNGNEITKEAH
nr:IAA-amino acid hydrolase ILR1 [Tanacetum cinerariifolium]